jgi:hypothetical protein
MLDIVISSKEIVITKKYRYLSSVPSLEEFLGNQAS